MRHGMKKRAAASRMTAERQQKLDDFERTVCLRNKSLFIIAAAGEMNDDGSVLRHGRREKEKAEKEAERGFPICVNLFTTHESL